MLFLLLWFHIVGLAALDGFPTRQVEVEKLSQILHPCCWWWGRRRQLDDFWELLVGLWLISIIKTDGGEEDGKVGTFTRFENLVNHSMLHYKIAELSHISRM